MIMIMMSHTLTFFLSGSLHFRIKFYCSDEDQSSKLCCFCLQDDARCRGDAPPLEKITQHFVNSLTN